MVLGFSVVLPLKFMSVCCGGDLVVDSELQKFKFSGEIVVFWCSVVLLTVSCSNSAGSSVVVLLHVVWY